MRVILATAAVMGLASVAGADTVLVMNPDSTGELNAAMRVAMAGRGTDVASTPAPTGDVRLARAAAAQRAAAQSGASAAVWIDSNEVCAVTPDGKDFRHAPFPVEARSARAFAAIAASLVDEMVGPSPWGGDVGVDVNVDVQVHGSAPARVTVNGEPATAPAAPPPRVAAIEMPAPAAPGMGEPVVVDVAAPPVHAHAGHTLVSIGPMLTPLTYGLEGGVAFPLSPDWRFAITGAINRTYTDNYVLGVGIVELAHTGEGLHRHWDLAPLAGWAEPDRSESAVFAGLRVARTYELDRSAVSVSIAPILMHVNGDGDGTTGVFPAVWGSVRWQLAL